MPTKAELERALVNAHNAGEVADAKVLANALKAGRYDDAAPARGELGGLGDLGQGISRGFANLAGIPVDAMTTAVNLVPGVDIEQPVGGSAWWLRALNAPAQLASEVTGAPAPAIPPVSTTAAGKAGEVLGGSALAGYTVPAQAARGLGTMGRLALNELTSATGAAAGAAGAEYFAPESELAGYVAPVVTGALGGAAAQAPGQIRRVLHEISPEQAAYRKVSAVLPEDAAARVADMGEDARLMDVSRQTQRTMEGAYNAPGGQIDEVGEFLTQRSARQGEALLSDLGPSRYGAALDNIGSVRATEARPLYARAYAQPLNMTDELGEILQTPTMQRLWKSSGIRRTAEDVASADGLPYNPAMFDEGPSTMGVDYLMRHLDREIKRTKVADPGRAANLMKLRGRLSDALTDAAPELKQARSVWAGTAKAEELIDEGTKFLRGRTSDTQRAIRALSDAELEVYRVGALDALEDRIGRLGDTHDVTKIFRNENTRRRLRELFRDDTAFDAWEKKIRDSMQMQSTFSQVAGGSPTARRLAERSENAELMGLALDFLPGNVGLAMRAYRAAQGMMPGGRSMNEQIARLLMARDMPIPPPGPRPGPPFAGAWIPGVGAMQERERP